MAESGIKQARELIKSEKFASAAELFRKLAAENPQAGEMDFFLSLATLVDLVSVPENLLKDIHVLENVQFVMHGGRIVKRPQKTLRRIN